MKERQHTFPTRFYEELIAQDVLEQVIQADVRKVRRLVKATVRR